MGSENAQGRAQSTENGRVHLMRQANTSKTAQYKTKEKFDKRNRITEHVHGCSTVTTWWVLAAVAVAFGTANSAN
jgi:hypothetical protein